MKILHVQYFTLGISIYQSFFLHETFFLLFTIVTQFYFFYVNVNILMHL